MMAAKKRRTPESWRQSKSQSSWRQIKGRDVEKLFITVFLFTLFNFFLRC